MTYPVRIDRRVRAPMPDGVELALTLYVPDAPSDGPFPAVVESLPYRKDDDCFTRDWQTFTYLAERGIAGVRIDIRGTGASDGVAAGEYLAQEQEDNVEVLRWLAAQDWCSGRLGMWGISWGGFSALQTAMLRPPGLEAICAMHATHDRYACDVHYIGGALHCWEQMDWPVGMLTTNALPPDPDIVGTRWLEMWLERLEATPQWLPEWIAHQTRDALWRHGSPCEDYSSIGCATLLVGGWLDPYVDGILEVLRHIDAPKRAVVGPWGHYRPATGVPAPTLDHFELMARWFGHWLCDADTGVMEDPLLKVFVREGPPYDPPEGRAPGRWRAEHAWPPADLAPLVLHLSGGALATETAEETAAPTWEGPWTVGATAPFWDLGGWGSTDTTPDDRRSLVWETEPLSEPLEVLGAATLELWVEVDGPGGRVAARLSDVDSEGRAHFLTRGVLNLSHRDDPADPTPEPVGVPFPVEVGFRHTSATLGRGHCLRLAVAGADFPLVWPPPRPVRLTVHTGPDRPGRLVLPVVPPRPETGWLDLPEAPPPPSPSQALADDHHHQVERTGEVVRVRRRTVTEELQPERGDLVYRWDQEVWVEASDGSPTSCVAGSVARASLRRPGWEVEATGDVRLSADEEAFSLRITVTASHDKKTLVSRTWDERTRREWT